MISPGRGSINGGTIVTVSGEGFDATAYCRFGSVITTITTIVSSSRLLCLSPPHAAASVVSLELSQNDGVDWTSLTRQYLYYGIDVLICAC